MSNKGHPYREHLVSEYEETFVAQTPDYKPGRDPRYWEHNYPFVKLDLTPRLVGKKNNYEQLEIYVEIGETLCEVPCTQHQMIRFILDQMFIGLVALHNSKESFERIMSPKKRVKREKIIKRKE